MLASRVIAKKDKGSKIFSMTRKVDAYDIKLSLHKRKSCGKDLSQGLVVSAFDTGTGKTSLLGIGAHDMRNLAKMCEISLEQYLDILVAAEDAIDGKTGSAGGKALLVSQKEEADKEMDEWVADERVRQIGSAVPLALFASLILRASTHLSPRPASLDHLEAGSDQPR